MILAGSVGVLVGAVLRPLVARLDAGRVRAGGPQPVPDGHRAVAAMPLRRPVPGRGPLPRPAALLPVLSGVLFAAMAGRFGPDPALPAFLYLVAAGLALAAVDLRAHRLPNAVTLPSYPVVVGLLAAAQLGGSGSGTLGRALLGGVAMFLSYLLVRALRPAGLGFGDVKLAGVLGLCTGWLGWGVWLCALVCASLSAGVVGVALLAVRRDRKAHMALGPCLIAGALTAVLAGQQLVDGYLAWLAPP